MRRLFCFIRVSPKYNHIHSFKWEAEGHIAWIKEKITVASETETVLLQFQSRKCSQPSEARRRKKQILPQNLQRDHGPGSNTLLLTQWILVLYIWTPKQSLFYCSISIVLCHLVCGNLQQQPQEICTLNTIFTFVPQNTQYYDVQQALLLSTMFLQETFPLIVKFSGK